MDYQLDLAAAEVNSVLNAHPPI